MGVMIFGSCALTLIFLIYTMFVMISKKPRIGVFPRIVTIVSIVASFISLISFFYLFINDEVDYLLAMSCVAMAFAFPAMIIVDLSQRKTKI